MLLETRLHPLILGPAHSAEDYGSCRSDSSKMGPVWLLMSTQSANATSVSIKLHSFELKLRSNKLDFFHFSLRNAEFHHNRVDL